MDADIEKWDEMFNEWQNTPAFLNHMADRVKMTLKLEGLSSLEAYFEARKEHDDEMAQLNSSLEKGELTQAEYESKKAEQVKERQTGEQNVFTSFISDHTDLLNDELSSCLSDAQDHLKRKQALLKRARGKPPSQELIRSALSDLLEMSTDYNIDHYLQTFFEMLKGNAEGVVMRDDQKEQHSDTGFTYNWTKLSTLVGGDPKRVSIWEVLAALPFPVPADDIAVLKQAFSKSGYQLPDASSGSSSPSSSSSELSWLADGVRGLLVSLCQMSGQAATMAFAAPLKKQQQKQDDKADKKEQVVADEDEEASVRWLQSRLFNGGLMDEAEAQVSEVRFLNALMSAPPIATLQQNQASGSDADVDEPTKLAHRLLVKLSGVSEAVRLRSLIPLVWRAAGCLFAVLLRHAHPSLALTAAAMAEAAADQPVTKELKTIWDRAYAIRQVLQRRKASGQDVEAVVAGIEGKAKWLISRVAQRELPPVALTATAITVADVAAVVAASPSPSPSPVQEEVKTPEVVSPTPSEMGDLPPPPALKRQLSQRSKRVAQTLVSVISKTMAACSQIKKLMVARKRLAAPMGRLDRKSVV